MEVVYYYDKYLKYSPVKKYLTRYSLSSGTSKMSCKQKLKLLSTIDDKIKYILKECNGRPRPPIAYPLKNYSFFEIKQSKNQSITIRILYFCKSDKMILLHAFEKPSKYDNDKKTNKDIDKNYKKANKHKKRFNNNPKTYEKY